MASKNNILEITTPGFTRIVDVNTADYTHYTKKKSDKSDQPGMMAEIAYPQGKIVMTRSEKNHHIIIQNTAFSSSSKKRRENVRSSKLKWEVPKTASSKMGQFFTGVNHRLGLCVRWH